MDFKTYQEEADKTAVYPRKRRSLEYVALGLASEAGEVAGKVKKILRGDDHDKSGFTLTKDGTGIHVDRRQQILDEVGDVLWYAAQVCTELNASLGQVAQANLSKLAQRAEEAKLKGDGDKR